LHASRSNQWASGLHSTQMIIVPNSFFSNQIESSIAGLFDFANNLLFMLLKIYKRKIKNRRTF
jgi:hypothetical protein